MRFDNLDDWLSWQMALHDKTIELGLERVSLVAERLSLFNIAKKVITVAGTNGKGSTVAGYETWLKSAGFRVASYTSPHLVRYNERIKIDAAEVPDEDICIAFEAIDQARNETVLTYFEFGTLAALWLIRRAEPDVAILEVGLGGRLDAVNIIDADMVHLTSIGIDHQGWLGDTREEIGFEKAGVLRQGIPVIANDRKLPVSVENEIKRLNCELHQLGRDFDYRSGTDSESIRWQSDKFKFDIFPPMAGENQKQNISGVIAGLAVGFGLEAIDNVTMNQRFSGASVEGRFQLVDAGLPARTFIDVGHNQDAARALSENLQSLKDTSGRIIVLLGMLEDKNAVDFVAQLKSVVDEWWLISLTGDRGISCHELNRRVEGAISVGHLFESIESARQHALLNSSNQDIILATGSFLTIELFLSAMPSHLSTDHSIR